MKLGLGAVFEAVAAIFRWLLHRGERKHDPRRVAEQRKAEIENLQKQIADARAAGDHRLAESLVHRLRIVASEKN